jgi:hypothetical protein
MKALVATAGAWREFVGRSAGADVLLVLGAQDLPDQAGAVVSGADLSRWTQDNAQPLPIGVQGDFVTDGGGLSFSPPPDDYGQRAIGLALDWLDERRTPGPPPPVESSHFDVAAASNRAVAVRALVPPQASEPGAHPIRFLITARDEPAIARAEKASFIVPR